ncbi:MAG TPA: hypothetical protein VFE47_04760 [Tepidisphaeraceae bacterium]|nr:hypothetical protein [Tepidisphaeraceae bacterium]
MTQTACMQVGIDESDTVEVFVPQGMRDEGLIAEFIGIRLRESGNRLAAEWSRAYHMGNGVFGFQDEAGAEFWLLHIGTDRSEALRVPDAEVFRLVHFVPDSWQS